MYLIHLALPHLEEFMDGALPHLEELSSSHMQTGLCMIAAKASDSCEETGTSSAVQGTGIGEAGGEAGGGAGAGAAQSQVPQVTVELSALLSLRQQLFGSSHPLTTRPMSTWV